MTNGRPFLFLALTCGLLVVSGGSPAARTDGRDAAPAPPPGLAAPADLTYGPAPAPAHDEMTRPGHATRPALVHPRRPEVVGHDPAFSARAQRQVLRYWTPRRMTRALPPTARTAARPLWQDVRAGMPAALPPAAPAAAPPLAATPPPPAGHRQHAAGPGEAGGGTLWAGRGMVARTSGKVFFTRDGRDNVCSAGTVVSANKDLVVTAAHCAKDGSWAKNWIFVPGYRDGKAPYGRFPARRMFTPRQWTAEQDDNFDVAMVKVAPAGGRHVVDAVGGQGIAFNQSRGRRLYAFGYPATGSYDGERLTYCAGTPRRDSHDLSKDHGLRCDMTQGSSGGPWLSGFDSAEGTGTITSVTSYKYATDPTMLYGPYFGDTVRALYEKAQRA